ncbi:MAG TPA: hypothetical protein PKZ42_13195 [Syntrophales bacterium]|nr:hypothetical protein [Syntrophales bacterium]
MLERISLLSEIKKGGYDASLITTFNAYLPFYEDVVLRKLVASGVRHNVLLMDAGQCTESLNNHPPRFAGRHYSLVPMYSKGAFHPKIILLVGKKKGALLIGSHNMTLAGFGFNREITNLILLESLEDNESIRLIGSAWHQIQGWVAEQPIQLPKQLSEMVNKIEAFAPWLKNKMTSEVKDCSVISSQPGSPSLWQQLNVMINENTRRIIVSGAFFDNKFEFMHRVLEDMAPRELYVGIDPDTVQIPRDAGNLKEVRFVNCGKMASSENNQSKYMGYLHAKSIVIETVSGTTYLVSGSANPSSPAWLSEGISGNIEMVVVRKGQEAESDARENGLLDIPSMPTLTEKDWEIAQSNWNLRKDNGKHRPVRTGVAVADDQGITFCVDLPELHSTLECEVLDHNKETLENVTAKLINGHYYISITPLVKSSTYYVRCPSDEKSFLYIVHHEEIVKAQSRTDEQRHFREALNSLNSDSPDLVTAIDCIDKIIFSKAKDTDIGTVKAIAGKKTVNEDNTEDPSLSIDVSETRKTKKKFRLRASNDLAYLLDVLIYHLKDGSDIERPLETQDHKGRTEEEQIGVEDDEEKHDEEDNTVKTLELCHRKIHTLVKRMGDRLEDLKKGAISIEDIIVRLTGVLAFLRYLRECDGKVSWIKQGQTSFPVKERFQLLCATASSLFERKHSILCLDDEFDGLADSEDLTRLKGLLLWLAWDCDLRLKLDKPFFEKPEEEYQRFFNNGLVFAVAQLGQNDDAVISEAKKSIAPMCSGDMDWLNWIVSIGEKLFEFSSNPERFINAKETKYGYLAFHPKVPTWGIRLVINSNRKFTNLLCFDREKGHSSCMSEAIIIIPLNNVLE